MLHSVVVRNAMRSCTGKRGGGTWPASVEIELKPLIHLMFVYIDQLAPHLLVCYPDLAFVCNCKVFWATTERSMKLAEL